jgi:hypothetical protein
LAAEDIEVVFDQPPGVSAFFKTLSLSGMSRSRMSLSRISIILGNITSTLVDKLVDLVYGGDSSKISTINYVDAKPAVPRPIDTLGCDSSRHLLDHN